jgi:sulfur-oxidizing protein SoxY
MQRRNFLRNSALVAGLAMTAIPTSLAAKKMTKKQAYKAIVGNKKAKSNDNLKFSAPEIAENGKVVPIKITLKGVDSSKVKSMHVISENQNPRTIDVYFTKHNKEAFVATRMKMGKTTNLTAIVIMKNGTVYKADRRTKITIGGCG